MVPTPNLTELISEILEKGYLVSLGTVDRAGVWVADVNYVADDEFNIYWISSPQVRHSQAITQNPKVAGTITLSQSGQPNFGIQFTGTSKSTSDLPQDIMEKYFTRRGKHVPEEGFLHGRSWYIVIPDFIDVIYEPLFGYNKQKWER